MPKLIDSDGLVLATTMELCEGCEEMKGCGDCLVNAFLTLINDCPTIEAEPVVRCSDCKHYKDGRCFYTMRRHGLHDDWFCADGTR